MRYSAFKYVHRQLYMLKLTRILCSYCKQKCVIHCVCVRAYNLHCSVPEKKHPLLFSCTTLRKIK